MQKERNEAGMWEKYFLTLPDSRYVLAGFSPGETYLHIRESLCGLQEAGYFPILTHVEWYQELWGRPSVLEELFCRGIYFQVNAGSLLGRNGLSQKWIAWYLARRRMLYLVSAGAGSVPGKRADAQQRRCMELVERHCGREYAEEIFYSNAAAVFHGVKILRKDCGGNV